MLQKYPFQLINTLRSTRCLALLALVILFRHADAAPQPAEQAAYARQYTAFALQSCDKIEANMAELTRVGQIIADRHLAGGLIGMIGNGHGLPEELTGRSGGIVHFGFDRPWKKERTPAENAKNIALVGWDRAPGAGELDQMKKAKEAGAYLVGFGPRAMPELAPHIALCDAWFDTGLGADGRVVSLPNDRRAGRGNLLVNMLNGWALMAEVVSALTRQGKMPTMWKSYMYPDGVEWGNKYFGKMQFHDDFKIAPIAAGTLSRAFLKEMRDNIKRFEQAQLASVEKAATMIVEELGQGRKTVVATSGHAPYTYVAKYEDALWANTIDLHGTVEYQVTAYLKDTPENALVLRLGYTGMHSKEAEAFAQKKQRVILLTTPNPNADSQPPKDFPLYIDMGYAYGDAVVSIEGYPIKLFPPSGIMQIVAYESINVEVLARLAQKNLMPA